MDYTNVTTTLTTMTNNSDFVSVLLSVLLWIFWILMGLAFILYIIIKCNVDTPQFFSQKGTTFKETCSNIKGEYPKYRITGTFSAFVLALFISMGSVLIGIYKYPAGKITDGYALTLLAPFVLTYWAIITVFVPIILVLPIALYIPSCIWFVFFELPADFLNGYFKCD